MNPIASPQTECISPPAASSRSQNWEHLLVEQFQHPAGEGSTCYGTEHAICLSLAPRPVRLLQRQGDRTYSGSYVRGDFCITPAQTPFFARWDDDDRFLQIRIAAPFLHRVAQETIARRPDRLELLPEFRTRDPQIEAIGMMLLAEISAEASSNRLYIDSLATVLAVHLLRRYAASRPPIAAYRGGLTQRQLGQVLDYISDHLTQEIKLADLAALLGISQFHFSHQFKQAIGTTPYQYLLQQRIDRAKHLLKHTDQAITDIALQCGFGSHSHLSKQFRQITGISPKTYRKS